MLREKGFSYREIAEWLSDRGVEVDHNAVYRVYTNSLSDHEAYLEDLREAEEVQQEARRNL
jgi:transposase-like protein